MAIRTSSQTVVIPEDPALLQVPDQIIGVAGYTNDDLGVTAGPVKQSRMPIFNKTIAVVDLETTPSNTDKVDTIGLGGETSNNVIRADDFTVFNTNKVIYLTPIDRRTYNTYWFPDYSGNALPTIDVSGGVTGLITYGGPLVSAGTITLSGVLNIEHGGTGATTAPHAINNLLPSQTGRNNQYLITDGNNVSWSTISISAVTSIDVNGGNTGLTTTGGPITASGVITLDGTLSITHGGTSATTAPEAINNLLPDQTTNNGKFLITDGNNVSWSSPVTSVDVNGGSTGLTTSGGPITSTGNITLDGILTIEHGGTNANTAPQAINNLLPTQATNNGKFLSTNGNNVSWTTVPVVSPAGSTGQIQFNDGGVFGANTNITFTKASGTLNSLNATISNLLSIKNVYQYFSIITGATGTVTHDCTTSTVFIHNSIIDNFTVSITNMGLPSNRVTNVVLILNQGSVPYMPTALSIDGSSKTIKWNNSITPTGTADTTDLVSFSIFNTGATYIVLGQLINFG